LRKGKKVENKQVNTDGKEKLKARIERANKIAERINTMGNKRKLFARSKPISDQVETKEVKREEDEELFDYLEEDDIENK